MLFKKIDTPLMEGTVAAERLDPFVRVSVHDNGDTYLTVWDQDDELAVVQLNDQNRVDLVMALLHMKEEDA